MQNSHKITAGADRRLVCDSKFMFTSQLHTVTPSSASLLDHLGMSTEDNASWISPQGDLADKADRLRQYALSDSSVPHQALRNALTASELSSQLLSDAIGQHTEAGFETQQVGNPNLKLEGLDDRIAQVRRGVENMDSGRLGESSKIQKQFLETWS